MALDISRVAAQIEGMTAQLQIGNRDRGERLQYALRVLYDQSSAPDPLRDKIERSNTTWLVAGLSEELAHKYQPAACPQDFTVIASDGSHIDVDRHHPVRCYLINIGGVILRYGQNPDAILISDPILYASDQELVIRDPQGNSEEPVERALLGVKRAIQECQALARLAAGISTELPTLALVDGSLILWALAGQAYPSYVKEELLKESFLKALDKLKEVSQRTKLALASYISFPRSTDVVNALRLAICPHDPADCDRHCCGGGDRDCEAVAGVLDRDLFQQLLKPGERTAVFASRSSIVRNYYGDHEIRFFYLRVDDEVARVEFPRWVEDMGSLDLFQAIILDQCRRGGGYPVVLAEAHEQAVITTADRDQFQQLVEVALTQRHLPALASAKSRSKQTRWI